MTCTTFGFTSIVKTFPNQGYSMPKPAMGLLKTTTRFTNRATSLFYYIDFSKNLRRNVFARNPLDVAVITFYQASCPARVNLERSWIATLPSVVRDDICKLFSTCFTNFVYANVTISYYENRLRGTWNINLLFQNQKGLNSTLLSPFMLLYPSV